MAKCNLIALVPLRPYPPAITFLAHFGKSILKSSYYTLNNARLVARIELAPIPSSGGLMVNCEKVKYKTNWTSRMHKLLQRRKNTSKKWKKLRETVRLRKG